MKDWLILLCIGIIAVLAVREYEHWASRPATPVAVVESAVNPPASGAAPLPADARPEGSAASDSPEKTELAELVAQSQRAAVAKYPALASVDSEISIRFNFRCKRLLEEHSPRLQDPAWPVQLADECARDSRLRLATSPPARTPPPGKSAAAVASMPLTAVAPADASTPPLRISPASPAAQTLVFHPVASSTPPTPVVPGQSSGSAPSQPETLPFVTLDAVNQTSGNNAHYNWISGWGSYDISFRQSVGVSINVRNMSRTPVELNLRWIFFARKSHNNERFVFAADGKELDLTPGQNATVAADSPMIQSRDVTYVALGERYLSGSKYEGWLVQLLERGSGRIIKQTGSTSFLEDLARRTDFSTLVEDYRTRLHGQGGV